MSRKMMMFAAACLLIVFTVIPCFAQSELTATTMKDGVEVCACDCLVACPVIMPGDVATAQDGEFGELKDCVSDVCDCDCVENGE